MSSLSNMFDKPMAIYHLEAKVVSRGAGRSAVAASAYLSCSRLYNDYDGIQHDYTKKQGLVWQQVFLPEYAPQEWQNREKLWNAVEEVETAKDSSVRILHGDKDGVSEAVIMEF